MQDSVLQANPETRRLEIDGLRVVAMMGVLYVHFWNKNHGMEHLRVSLFFVVSGFIITMTLLKAKDGPNHVNIRNFYIRRALRLFPALFMALFVACLFDMAGIRASILWHLAQLSNAHFVLQEDWSPWVAAHLWSLNIVEQFYVICPLAVFALTRRRLMGFFAAVMLTSIILRLIILNSGINNWHTILVTFDPIAAGCLLAMVKDNKVVRSLLTNHANLVVGGLFVLSPILFLEGFGSTIAYRMVTVYALASIVLRAYVGFGGVARTLFTNASIRFLSKISYGIYVYHFFLWWLAGSVFHDLYRPGAQAFFVMTALTVIVATLSWYGVERHFDRLKVFFPLIGTAPNKVGAV